VKHKKTRINTMKTIKIDEEVAKEIKFLKTANVQVVPIDFGHSSVKGFDEDGRPFEYAMALKPRLHKKGGLEDLSTIFVDGEPYLFGEMAKIGAIPIVNFGGISKFIPSITEFIILNHFPSIDLNKTVYFTVGLTKLDMQERNTLISLMENIEVKKDFYSEPIKVKSSVQLRLQGEGIFATYCNENKIPLRSSSNINMLVMDFGSKSTDILVYGENGNLLLDSCFSVDLGMNTMIEATRKHILSRLPAEGKGLEDTFSDSEIRKAIENTSIYSFREEYVIKDFLEEQKKQFMDKLLAEIHKDKERLQVFRFASMIILGGGGSYFITSDTLENYQKANKIFKGAKEIKDKVWGNAKGNIFQLGDRVKEEKLKAKNKE